MTGNNGRSFQILQNDSLQKTGLRFISMIQIYVDHETKKRTLKDSAYEYKQIIESNGECL